MKTIQTILNEKYHKKLEKKIKEREKILNSISSLELKLFNAIEMVEITKDDYRKNELNRVIDNMQLQYSKISI